LRRFLLVLLLLLALVAGAWFLFAPAGPHLETFVEIAPGTSSKGMGRLLEERRGADGEARHAEGG
jgi:UPF0755 protein